LAGMLSLKPEDEKSLHPEALKWFNAQRAEIRFEVPLEELSDDDLNTFLLNDEKREFQSCMEEISKGLYGCINKDAVSPDPVTNATIGLSLVTFQVNSLTVNVGGPIFSCLQLSTAWRACRASISCLMSSLLSRLEFG
jgi:hypothetical protein